MFSTKDFKVELVNREEVKKYVEEHGRFAAICYGTDEKYSKGVGSSCMKSGHMSGSRSDFFKFKITKVPRYTVDQAVRHEQGVVKNVQSQRYVDMANFNLYIADILLRDNYLKYEMEAHEKETRERYNRMKKYLEAEHDIKGEKANDLIRPILPIGCESSFNFALNLEGLTHFCNVRLCRRADKPIQELAKKMRDAVLEVAPIYKDRLVSKCEKDLYCTEDKCCKYMPVKAEVMAKLKEIGLL